MIDVAEAKKLVLEHALAPMPAKVDISESAALVLAEDIYAATDIPDYAQSSMDGYAFLFTDWKNDGALKIEGVIAAGNTGTTALAPGTAARIFTGAALPPSADTVVMQEKIRIENGYLIIDDENILQGLNVRPKGAEIKAGGLALPTDTLLTPAAIGFLAGIGIKELPVYRAPVISIVVTGNELQTPGQPLLRGQVYESNSLLLKAALKQLHIGAVQVYHAKDELEALKDVLNKAMQNSDIVFITGGVSVGDYDFVVEAATQCGTEKIFHKIKQKPGKPFYFGKKNSQLIFGLPGNPSSVLTCFYEYVEPALQQIMKKRTNVQALKVPMEASFKKAAGLTHFLKGWYDGNSVRVLQGQESYRLSSFANANCLIKMDEEHTFCDKGELIEIHILPV